MDFSENVRSNWKTFTCKTIVAASKQQFYSLIALIVFYKELTNHNWITI